MIAHILWGVVTYYATAQHQGNPLACDCGHGLVYAESTAPWVAIDPAFGQCGDVIAIWSVGEVRRFPALDTGPLFDYCVMDGDECRTIGADVPEMYAWFYPHLSTGAVVVNESAARRMMEVER